MADEYMIAFTADANTLQRLEPSGVFLVVGDVMTITTKFDEDFESWGSYVEDNPNWKNIHVKSGFPLSSLFGRNGYISADWFPYNEKTKSDYEKAMKSIDGKTRTFKPKSNQSDSSDELR